MLLWLLWWDSGSCCQPWDGGLVSQTRPGWCLQAYTHQKPRLAFLRLILGPSAYRWFYMLPLLCGPLPPFGLHSSQALFNEYADALQYAMKTNHVQDLQHYLDYYFTVGPPYSPVCANNIATMIAMCKELAFTINVDKITKPATTTNFLGVDIDWVAMEARINSTCLFNTICLLEGIVGHLPATKRSILSIIGKLHFICQVCRPGRTFLWHMIETSMKAWHLHHRIKLNQEIHRDVEWWLYYLPSCNGVSLLYESHWITSAECQLFTEASNVGFGFYFQGHWCQDEFPDTCYLLSGQAYEH